MFQGTIGYELLHQVPDLDVILVRCNEEETLIFGIRKVLIDHVVPAFNLMDILAFDYPFHISGAYLRGRNDLRNCFGCQVSCSQLQVASPWIVFLKKFFIIIFGNIKPFVHAGWWQLSQPERSCCAAFRAKKDCEYLKNKKHLWIHLVNILIRQGNS